MAFGAVHTSPEAKIKRPRAAPKRFGFIRRHLPKSKRVQRLAVVLRFAGKLHIRVIAKRFRLQYYVKGRNFCNHWLELQHMFKAGDSRGIRPTCDARR
ncbi:hypothetical protein XM53_01920 [Roseovarius atlanticus]|uniref:Uncharacterized protein n=1 Tax=Roseovarius atlanticus TaxID=1641875 RepID=A0A0T5P057_9RHOB|nr:hypothetical protein XM53_01920 [Roseovarius atlanticus]